MNLTKLGNNPIFIGIVFFSMLYILYGDVSRHEKIIKNIDKKYEKLVSSVDQTVKKM